MSLYQDTCTALGIALAANVPTLIEGLPGQGKSSVIEALAEGQKLHLETVIASLRDPADFNGLPKDDVETRSGVRMVPPAFAYRLADVPAALAADPDNGPRGGLLFLDEITTAPPATQAALLRVVLDRVVGELELPPSTRCVAAANPAAIAAGGWDLAPPLANRFLHLEWNLPANIVVEGFTLGWPDIDVPVVDEAEAELKVTEYKGMVAAYLGANNDKVTQMPNSAEASGKAFATPRTWEQTARLLAYADAAGANSTVRAILVNGSVGSSVGGEFLVYMANLDLPNAEDVLARPDSWTVPSDRQDKVFVVASSVYTAMKTNLTPERWKQAGAVYARIANHGHPDIAFTFARRWIEDRPANTMPDTDTLQSLMPILGALGRLQSA